MCEIFTQYSGTSRETGSIGALYDLLVQAGIDAPVNGNQGGSYLTMKSNQGMVFGAAGMLSGFAGVFCDQGRSKYDILLAAGLINMNIGYWQRVSLTSNRLQSANTVRGHRQCARINYKGLRGSGRA